MKLGKSILIFCLAVAGSAQASVLAYEGFSGYTGSTLDQSNGGSGWAGSWHGWDESGNAQFDLNSTTSLPQGAAPNAPIGGHVSSPGDGTDVATRIMATPLQTDVAGTYYFSYLFRRDAGFSQAGIAFYNSSGTPSTSDLYFGALYDSPDSALSGELGLYNSGGSIRHENAITNGVDYFIVVKLVMNESGADDNIYVNLYESGDTVPEEEPLSWEFSKTGSSITPTTLDTIYLRNTSGQVQSLDEFRLGTTWEDAAVKSAVPEPSTLALSGIGILLFLHRSMCKFKTRSTS